MQPEPRQELEWCPWCHQTVGQALETGVTMSGVPRNTFKHLLRPLTRAWMFISCSVTASPLSRQTLDIGVFFKVSRRF